jgi:hypothetical protein
MGIQQIPKSKFKIFLKKIQKFYQQHQLGLKGHPAAAHDPRPCKGPLIPIHE